jgi:nitronate monooxygenase
MKTALTELLHIEHPLLVAPMFLISTPEMLTKALKKGVTAAIPAQNFRTTQALSEAIINIKQKVGSTFGINLIVNKSNPNYEAQLEIILEEKPDFIITSLGNPHKTIQKCKDVGIKVFCDVVDTRYAEKVINFGADAIIAVCKEAGGHAGNIPAIEFIPMLKKQFKVPIIAAGGVATNQQYQNMLNLGADGVSSGTVFIASQEANISNEYRQALIKYGAKDIVRTTKLSGAPLTVINTPYVQQIGTKATAIEWILNHNKRLKKYAKKYIMKRGSKILQKAALQATYKNVWCAGTAIEHIKSIRPITTIIDDIINE